MAILPSILWVLILQELPLPTFAQRQWWSQKILKQILEAESQGTNLASLLVGCVTQEKLAHSLGPPTPLLQEEDRGVLRQAFAQA